MSLWKRSFTVNGHPILFPLFVMDQFFKAVNISKREFVCAWCLSEGARFFSWATSPHGAIFALLLRESDMDWEFNNYDDPFKIAGRWAGDRVVLIGNYDSKRLWYEAKNYLNISWDVADVWNRFVDDPGKKLTVCKNCYCEAMEP